MTDVVQSLDLNLLRTLDALLRTGSVTQAAAALGRSQPATSHGLQRLRDALADPLMVRDGRGMVMTPRAEALRPAVAALLQDLRQILTEGTSFDPKSARREFTLGCPDMLAPVLPKLLAAMKEAPGVSLTLRNASDATGLDNGSDLVVGALPTHAPGVMARRLGSIDERVALRKGHPALSAPWTPSAFVAWPHILVRTPGAGPSLLEQALAAEGLTRRVGLVVPTFLLAPHVVSNSDMLFTGAGVLLEQVTGPLGLVLRPCPVVVQSVTAAAIWPERLSASPGHRWFRNHVIDVFRQLLRDA